MKNKFAKLFLVLVLLASIGIAGCDTGGGTRFEETGEELDRGTQDMQQEMDERM